MRLSKEDAVKIYGENFVNELLNVDAEPTSRVIYPGCEPEHADKVEYIGGTGTAHNGDNVTIYYYFDENECKNLGFIDWADYAEFEMGIPW